jgi:hypothetical protein
MRRFAALTGKKLYFERAWCPLWQGRVVEASWNVMEHAQKPDLVFRRNGRVHVNRRRRQFRRLLAAEVCASALIVGSNAGYTMFRGSEKGTGYSFHSPVSPSLPLPCVTACHHIATGVYYKLECLFHRNVGISRLGATSPTTLILRRSQFKISELVFAIGYVAITFNNLSLSSRRKFALLR